MSLRPLRLRMKHPQSRKMSRNDNESTSFNISQEDVIFYQVVPITQAKDSAAFHVDLLNEDAEIVYDRLHNLRRYNEIIFSTFSANGEVILYYVAH